MFPGGRGRFGRGLWHRRGADCAAQVEPAAGAARGVEEAAPVGDLFCSVEPGAWLSISGGNLFLHSGLNIDNMAHLGGFTCGLLFAVPMVPRLGSPRSAVQWRGCAIAVGTDCSGLLVLFCGSDMRKM